MQSPTVSAQGPWRISPVVAVTLLAALPVAAQNATPAALPDLAELSPQEAYALANELWREGRKDDAAAVCRQLVADEQAQPAHRAGAHWILAQFYHDAEREAVEAIKHLRIIERDYPDSEAWVSGIAPYVLVGLILYRSRDPAAAVTLAEEYLVTLGARMSPLNRARLTLRLADAHGQTGNTDVAEGLLAVSVPDCLPILDQRWYHEKSLEVQLANRSDDAALSTARIAFALCKYNAGEIETAVALVRRAFLATDRPAEATQFLLALGDPDRPSPLAEVPLPALSEADTQALLDAAGDDPVLRITAYLYLGRHEEALATALEYLRRTAPEQAARAVVQVPRCLKALDLNLVRANQFIEFIETGEGVNPLQEWALAQGIEADAIGEAVGVAVQAVTLDRTGWLAGGVPLPPGESPAAPVPAMFTAAAGCIEAIQEGNMGPEEFVRWAEENSIGPEALSAAVGLLAPNIRQLRLDDGTRVLAAGLLAAAGEGLERLDAIPAPGLLLLAIYLGVLDREEDARRALSRAAELDHGMPVQVPYYIVATGLYRAEKALETAIWAWQTGANAAGPPQQAHVSLHIWMACYLLDERGADTAALRDIFIPWTEEALGLAGSEPQWAAPLESLLMAYWRVHGYEAAIVLAEEWLDRGERRGVPDHRLAGGRLAVALMLADHGEHARAEAILRAISDAGCPEAAARAEWHLEWLEELRRTRAAD